MPYVYNYVLCINLNILIIPLNSCLFNEFHSILLYEKSKKIKRNIPKIFYSLVELLNAHVFHGVFFEFFQNLQIFHFFY